MEDKEYYIIRSLDEIESHEARLLSWGIVDGYLTRDELLNLINRLFDNPDFENAPILGLESAHEVISELLDMALIFEFDSNGESYYRSRMAESVRLFFYLRQLLHKHSGDQKWQDAPTLVSDFRFIRRKRRYPKREVMLEEAVSRLQEGTPVEYHDILEETLSGFPDGFKFATFQVEAITRILCGFDQESSKATLVSAGTGSGKTIAFYIPALTRIAKHILSDPMEKKWVKVLSVYPRKELLKDQFAEVYRQARHYNDQLTKNGQRKIIIGTLFGATPYNAKKVTEHEGWSIHPDGVLCDFMQCPSEGCRGKMLWQKKDLEDGIERLTCYFCDSIIESDEIILTRDRLKKESPDILFTTTEMLNQRMGDNELRHLFGLGNKCKKPVEMMLLDEVHTYSGTTGAHVAYLLRRWKRLINKPINFVGLSATLSEGTSFFSKITNVPEHFTLEISSNSDSMEEDGAEYLLALRGDPVSQTALLSTTVQTAMLLSRMLDTPNSPKSKGIFGERLFMFADNIDVINRMYFTMLDVEGRDSFGAPEMKQHKDGGLAILREPRSNRSRMQFGQDWFAPKKVGHTLQSDDRKNIGRVMSLDPGIDGENDIYVASASLEVGYNDPLVGGIIQHKAPRGVAQFIQRKGRAGRSRKMRPWTIVVLSDYGRDRLVYQGYDLLFNPLLPPISLPISNRYVERIQSVYATMDFLSQLNIMGLPNGSVWRDFAVTSDYSSQKKRQTEFTKVIEGILTNEVERDRLTEFLEQALDLDSKEILQLLWGQPRPLLTEVLPTALRRLETEWRDLSSSGRENQVTNSPLPEFVPPNLFSDLNLPEVEIKIPESKKKDNNKNHFMPITQALTEFAPGRITRRYGLNYALERHWICPSLDKESPEKLQKFNMDSYIKSEYLGEWQYRNDSGEVKSIPAYRPLLFHVKKPEGAVTDTSNARLQWHTQLIASKVGERFIPPRESEWSSHIENVEFFMHRNLNPVEMRRMAIASDANIRYLHGQKLERHFTFEIEGSEAALGFNLAVDSMCIRLKFPKLLWSELVSENNRRSRAVRTAYFVDQVINGDLSDIVESKFAREWLAQVVLTTISYEAVNKSISLSSAIDNISKGEVEFGFEKTLNVIFHSIIVEELSKEEIGQDKLRIELEELLAKPEVMKKLLELAKLLYTPIKEDWEPWLRRRFAITTASAALNTITSLCPDIDREGLLIDIDVDPNKSIEKFQDNELAEIWISESSPGGNGQIEDILQAYGEDPARFYSLLSSSLQDNEQVLTDFQLQRFLNEIVENSDFEISEAASKFRNSNGVGESHESFKELRETLVKRGFVNFHTFQVALANRVLRAGSGENCDKFLYDTITAWNQFEEDLGIELDSRVIAFWLSRDDKLDTALDLDGIEVPLDPSESWRFGVLYGLLWPRGAQIRQSGLQLYSPFTDLPLPEPLLVSRNIDTKTDTVIVDNDDWKSKCLEKLGSQGIVTIECSLKTPENLANALNYIATTPVEYGYLTAYARVQSLRRNENAYYANLDIVEVSQ